MQLQPVRIYNKEKTEQLKLLLNTHHHRNKVPYARIAVLVIAGADPNVKADSGYYQNHLWLDVELPEKDNIDFYALLLKHGADPNDNLLACACTRNCYEHVLMLLDYGVNVNEKTMLGWSPLHSAVLMEKIKMVELLLERGGASDIDAPDTNGSTPFSIAQNESNPFSFAQKRSPEIFCMLERHRKQKIK